MKTMTYLVPSINCNHCVNTIQNELAEIEGVISVRADSIKKEVLVEFDDPATSEAIEALLTEINYPAKK